MRTIVLISCVSKKKEVESEARELYQSTLFKLALKYAEKIKPDKIFILSALHGVVELEQVIRPYNVTLNNMSEKDRKTWSEKVINQLKNKNISFDEDKFIILAGNNYRKYLVRNMKHVEVPMEGLKIGQQLSYLKEKVINE
ncbi:DUF6884 domain-containing protein [Maledivibacter halophilus]|uniref:DUF6884 domain-containing protein n=1 Tax=Maledivibacter halophilus TaxID=36842 RepID=A0A1T5KYA6_9FIRM|nr:DUF6884 domain-containing protein [Maledivibacter halophilus]SKC68792.1 hypothetical protein SAMN02194393_02190 [Maledivibacter halophilus]